MEPVPTFDTDRERSASDGVEFTSFKSGGRPRRFRQPSRRQGFLKARPQEKVKMRERFDWMKIRFLCSFCAINSRWVLWSNLLFFLGNIFYILMAVIDLDCYRLDQDEITEDMLPGWVDCEDDARYTLYNFCGCFLFFLNPISDLLGSYAERKVKEIHDKLQYEHSDTTGQRGAAAVGGGDNPDPSAFDDEEEEEEEEDRAVKASKPCSWVCAEIDWDEIDYDKHVAIIFLVGSVFYIFQAFAEAYGGEDGTPVDFLLDVLGSHIMLLDSVVGLIGWFVARRLDRGTSRQRWLLAIRPTFVDWSGWGDWLFFFGSVVDVAVTYLSEVNQHWQHVLDLVSSLLWVVDATFYVIGYVYGQDVRKRFANKYYTSLVHVEEELSDDDDDDEEDDDHDNVQGGQQGRRQVDQVVSGATTTIELV